MPSQGAQGAGTHARRLGAHLAPLLAVPFGAGAIHHVAAVVRPTPGDSSSALRHLVFVSINAFFALAFGLRARWLLAPALLLSIQQVWSHGQSFVEAWRAGSFDLESALVLLFMPCVVAVGVSLAREGREMTK